MNRTAALFAVLPFALVLEAAGPAPYSRTDPGFGLTVETNIVAQTIDMTPNYAGVPMEGSDGRRSADAYRRYQNGNVKKLLQTNGDAKVGGQGGAIDSTTVITPNN